MDVPETNQQPSNQPPPANRRFNRAHAARADAACAGAPRQKICCLGFFGLCLLIIGASVYLFSSGRTQPNLKAVPLVTSKSQSQPAALAPPQKAPLAVQQESQALSQISKIQAAPSKVNGTAVLPDDLKFLIPGGTLNAGVDGVTYPDGKSGYNVSYTFAQPLKNVFMDFFSTSAPGWQP